ncbi:hypothetical protein IKF32_03340 [Candidatus Saccharibacteria bacterium]|nr:hypothetical protein [Candidatus Saccharibacteria bacterium]
MNIKRFVIAVIAIAVMSLGLLAFSACDSTTTKLSYEKIPDDANIPELVKYENSGSSFSFLVDKGTGVVYLYYNGYRQAGITVMLNADGTPVTAEQLGLE